MIDLVTLTAVFWAFHMLSKWNEAFKAAKLKGEVPPGFVEFYQGILPSVLASIGGTVGAFMLVDGMGWMNAGMAGACGYMGSSVSKKLVDQFQSKVGA